MKYEVLLEKGDYALILRGSRMEEYAIVCGLDKEKGCWDWTSYYWNFGAHSKTDQAKALSFAIDCFRFWTEENYISRPRLEELATLMKDEFLECDKESAMECFDEICEMSDEEKEWFGISESEEDI